MAMNNAERQAAYRAKRRAGKNNEYRLSTWISAESSGALRRIAKHEGLTQRAVIEMLLRNYDEALSDKLNPESPEFDKYYSVTQ